MNDIDKLPKDIMWIESSDFVICKHEFYEDMDPFIQYIKLSILNPLPIIDGNLLNFQATDTLKKLFTSPEAHCIIKCEEMKEKHKKLEDIFYKSWFHKIYYYIIDTAVVKKL